MAESFPRIPSLKNPAAFRQQLEHLGVELPCDDELKIGPESPLAQPIPSVSINGKTPGNRLAIQPMEGWDASATGGVTDEVMRRWGRFGESGAKIICGGEAMAVRPDGRANPRQLIIEERNRSDLTRLREHLVATHREHFGTSEDLVVGFQLTHSGRFCRPHEAGRLEPRVAHRHPILDRRFGVTSDAQVLSDDDVERLMDCYVVAARIAEEAGADFVDLKHCHGYLLHEFLGAHLRPGKFGGSFENRTRILREIIARIRAAGIRLEIAVRLSAFDVVPFRPDPSLSQPNRPGPGIAEDFADYLPYRYGFGVNAQNPLEPDLTEVFAFAQLCADLGVKILNLSAGSPYYNPHIQRPAAYPPSDGYQPPHDPLIDVARQIQVVRQIKQRAPGHLIVMGAGLSYLQEFLPLVAQALVREGWTDVIGLGRMALSYPRFLLDAMTGGRIENKLICRTFSDCTTAPRNGLISGCYPLDRHYATRPEAQQLRDLKRANRS